MYVPMLTVLLIVCLYGMSDNNISLVAQNAHIISVLEKLDKFFICPLLQLVTQMFKTEGNSDFGTKCRYFRQSKFISNIVNVQRHKDLLDVEVGKDKD